MRINWFSPVEPARTGIAQYTNMIVPWLARHAEICVWVAQRHWNKELEAHAEVREYRAEALPWTELNRADLTFFHMGNNVEFHCGVWLASIQYPGIVVLHDTCYPDFFSGIRHRWDEGRIGEEFQLAERFPNALSVCTEADPAAHRTHLLPAVLEKAIAALVHSRSEFDALSRALECPVIQAALPYPPASNDTLLEWERRRQTARKRHRLVAFGYLNWNRRVESILDILPQFSSQFELHIYGQLTDSRSIQEKIRALGLQNTVHLYGYAEDLDREIAQADLAINLRYPTMGEASGSQLRIWDHALPSIVTKVGWYAHLPEDSVLFVRPEAEREDLEMHLRAFLADPARFARIGENGRRALLANHSPEEYAKALTGLSQHARAFQSAAAAFPLADRAGGDMKLWFDLHCEGFTERISREIGAVLGS